jgi:hypothetical protein
MRFHQMDSRVAELEEKIKFEGHESVDGSNENLSATENENSSESSSDNLKTSVASSRKTDSESRTNGEKLTQDVDPIESEDLKNTDQLTSPTGQAVLKDPSDLKAGDSSTVGLALTTTAASTALSMLFGEDPKPPPGDSPSTHSEGAQNLTQSSKGAATLSMEAMNSSAKAFSPAMMSGIVPSSSVSPQFIQTQREVDYYSPARKNWFVFVYGMANYTHRRIVAEMEGAEAIPNQLNQAENGLITPGAGLQLSRELGKSFRMGIGVEYNQWIQEGNYSTEVVFSDVEVMINTATGFEQFDFEGSVESSLGNTQYNSSSDENPFGIGFETLSPDVDPVEFNIRARQQINYLSIPISLEYVYNAYPFTFTAGGGLSVNHILGSSTEYTLEDGAPDLEIAPMKKIEGTYLAFQAGVAVEYGLSERMSIRLNPSYRGWMTPIFENEQIKTVPFGVAVRAGLIYRLNP